LTFDRRRSKIDVVLILASASPRRFDLLSAAGFTFTVRPVDIDEQPLDGESPRDYVLRLAIEKAAAAAAAPNANPGEVVLAADTSVVVGDQILGKPRDGEDARRMLALLSGREHEVLTGVAIRRDGREVTALACSRVHFLPLTTEEITWYVASGEPMDKAGAYAVQGLASRFVAEIHGSYANVVGLPVALVYKLLTQAFETPCGCV
jgi:septum formation protein